MLFPAIAERLRSRLAYLLPFFVVFIAVNTVLRLGLGLFGVEHISWRILPALLLGLLFDVAAFSFFAVVLTVVLNVWPQRAVRSLFWFLAALALPFCLALLLVAGSEITFWNEFASRFNFIAVDYLIYTNEVLGNIRESYNLPLLFAAIGALTLLLWAALLWLLRKTQSALQAKDALQTRPGWLPTVAVLLSTALPIVVMQAGWKEFSSDAQMNEVAGNGYFDFVHAFNSNEIDYARFYKTLPEAQVKRELAEEMAGDKKVSVVPDKPYQHRVQHTGAPRRMNVVLVSIESFSAEFMGSFGNTQKLTPNMDQLAREGMLFTRLYATGTRTVRGLEALTLSIPPTPGFSIVKRPNNDHLFTIGEVFREQGYEPLYIYGGYSYFDNMQAFFSGNGYTVIDRTALDKKDIHYENIWGVADEDLFTLALRELNQRHAAGKPFFAHIMTTSNHRPYTYPEGRIDIPSKSGREGAVKYTDWAIGNFVQRARQQVWFDNTLFIFVADHTHKGRGRTDLPPENYHIPAIFYAPKLIAPQQVDSIASQIDMAPTMLGLLNFSYESRFFGQDILREGRTHQRALMANYQTVGYYEDGKMVQLKPNSKVSVVDAATDMPIDMQSPEAQDLVDDAIGYYQTAAQAFTSGGLKLNAALETPASP